MTQGGSSSERHAWNGLNCEKCNLHRNERGLYWRGWFQNRLRRAGPCPGFKVDPHDPVMMAEDRAWRSAA
jgi:hypothetical protein